MTIIRKFTAVECATGVDPVPREHREPACMSLKTVPCRTLQHLRFSQNTIWNRDSALGIVYVYGLDDRGIGVQDLVVVRFFSSPRLPDQFCGPPSLISNGYRG
jgi:hypothetical protein